MTDEWSDALAALLAAGARFIVVGAHAMAVHGVTRATQDLDIWVDATEENAARVWEALALFGAPLRDLGITTDDFARPDTVIQIGLRRAEPRFRSRGRPRRCASDRWPPPANLSSARSSHAWHGPFALTTYRSC